MFLLVSLQDSEYIGDVYQDDVNQAALLLYRDKTDDALLMVRIFGIFNMILTILAFVKKWSSRILSEKLSI